MARRKQNRPLSGLIIISIEDMIRTNNRRNEMRDYNDNKAI